MTRAGGFIAGDILTAANTNLLPGGILAYAAKTSNQTGISTIADITSLTGTFTAVTGRYYRITLTGYLTANSAGAGTTMNAFIRDSGGTAIATHQMTAYTTGVSNTFTLVAYVTPTAGSVTYKASASCSSGTMTFSASSTIPAVFAIEDVSSP